jgi:hypothetical protein
MATAPVSRRLNLTRDQLSAFLTDQQQIRQFELLFAVVDELQTITGTDFEYQADTAAATANEALAQISALAQKTAIEDAVLNAKVQEVLDAIPRLSQSLDLLALAPPILPPIPAAPIWIDLVSRPSTLVGTSTVSGVSGDVRLHVKVGKADVYRFIPSPYDPLLDAFYSSFVASVLSGLIVVRA